MQMIFLFLLFMITLTPLIFEVMGFEEIEKVKRGTF